MKFVNVWKDSPPERGEDMMEDVEEEEVLEETEDRALEQADVAEVSWSCESSFICADE
jgi:hypothetical protein